MFLGDAYAREVVEKYEGYGLLLGFGVGLITGLMIAGPEFYHWPPLQSLLVIVGITGVATIIGFLAGRLALAFSHGGAGASPEDVHGGCINPQEYGVSDGDCGATD